MLSRRSFVLGGAAVATTGAVATGAAVQQGWLPGRPWLQERLGLDGPDGRVPDVEPGPVVSGSFVSAARGGVETGWSLLLPPGDHRSLRIAVALHPLGGSHATLTGPQFGLDRFLAAAVADGVAPFAIATVDGGRSYWHERPDGEDAGAMVLSELLPMLVRADHPVEAPPVGFLGWSMGGFGALRLGAVLGRGAAAAVVAVSPAIWSDPEDASKSGFDDAAEYEEFTLFGRQSELQGISLRVDCGTADPFYRDVEEYVEGLPEGDDSSEQVVTFEPGGHDAGYWRRMLPEQLAFLGRHLSAA